MMAILVPAAQRSPVPGPSSFPAYSLDKLRRRPLADFFVEPGEIRRIVVADAGGSRLHGKRGIVCDDFFKLFDFFAHAELLETQARVLFDRVGYGGALSFEKSLAEARKITKLCVDNGIKAVVCNNKAPSIFSTNRLFWKWRVISC